MSFSQVWLFGNALKGILDQSFPGRKKPVNGSLQKTRGIFSPCQIVGRWRGGDQISTKKSLVPPKMRQELQEFNETFHPFEGQVLTNLQKVGNLKHFCGGPIGQFLCFFC